MKQLKISLLLTVIFSTVQINAQHNKPLNLHDFAKNKYHWGFWLGYTQSSLVVTRKPDYSFADSLISITPVSVGSFAVGPMGSFSFTENVKLRTAILLSFQDRNVDYLFYKDDTTELFSKKLRSVYTEMPIQFKFVTDRINNTAFYATLGGKFGFDWSSNVNVKEQFNFDDVLKIKRMNFAYSVGGGVDFYLQYFKFGIDLRMDFGINNILVKNKTFYSSPLEQLRTRMWQLSFTFEG